jgi:hypothetical protein
VGVGEAVACGPPRPFDFPRPGSADVAVAVPELVGVEPADGDGFAGLPRAGEEVGVAEVPAPGTDDPGWPGFAPPGAAPPLLACEPTVPPIVA